MPYYKLPKYTSIGSYPLYLQRGGLPYCTSCASSMEPEDGDVVDANWENPNMKCADCDRRIESAYAEHLQEPG